MQVTDKDKKGQGGGIAEEGEFIDVVEMGVEEVGMSTMYEEKLKILHLDEEISGNDHNVAKCIYV